MKQESFQKQVEEWLAEFGGTNAKWERSCGSDNSAISIIASLVITIKDGQNNGVKRAALSLQSDSPDEDGVKYCVQSMNETLIKLL